MIAVWHGALYGPLQSIVRYVWSIVWSVGILFLEWVGYFPFGV